MTSADHRPPAGRAVWLAAVALLVLAGFIVPYGILGGSGAPGLTLALFWLIFGLAVVVVIALGVARWRD
ncbi:hypothetical protein C2I36_11645 [Rhodobacteraceae bacterium WD3A24]|nr:hypothetical protein C2I36_11645 [Rhodobacteraceae bacterium WD3A24]